MAFGAQVLDALGRTLLDTTMRSGRFLGSVETSGTNGSITVPAFAQGAPFAVVLDANLSITDIYTFKPWLPIVTISGTTLSWDYSAAGSAYRANATIIYGVY